MNEQPPSAPAPFTNADLQPRLRQPSDERLRDLANGTRQQIDELGLRYRNTKNPVYAWRAINLVRLINRAHRHLSMARMELPDWVLRYLSNVARRICDLASGIDYREAPPPFGEWSVDPREPWDKVVDRINSREKTLSHGTAMKQVLSALELQRRGKNMFAIVEDLQKAELTESYIEMLMLTVGVSQEEAIAMFIDPDPPDLKRAFIKGAQKSDPTFFVADERGVKKRLARARKAREDSMAVGP